jgi:hypothetical protein
MARMLSPCRFSSSMSCTSLPRNTLGTSSTSESMPALAFVRGGRFFVWHYEDFCTGADSAGGKPHARARESGGHSVTAPGPEPRPRVWLVPGRRGRRAGRRRNAAFSKPRPCAQAPHRRRDAGAKRRRARAAPAKWAAGMRKAAKRVAREMGRMFAIIWAVSETSHGKCRADS